MKYNFVAPLKLFIQKLSLGKLVPKLKSCWIWIFLNLVRLENFHTGQFEGNENEYDSNVLRFYS